MRFALLWSLLAADAAVASVCKPRQSSGSSTAATAEIETTTTTSVELSTSIATSTVEDVAITETTASTLTVAETTTSDIAGPLETFILAAKVEGTVSEELSGADRDGSPVVWPTPRFIASGPLIISIDSTTSYLQTSGGFYLCVAYGDGTTPNGVKLCSAESLNNPAFGALTCEQMEDRKIACEAQAGQCISDGENNVCSQLPGTYDQFYYYRGLFNGVYLGIGYAVNTDESQHPVELKARRSSA
ncbi:hypothetical protein BFJ63_vAg8613 [Fusarium oxysporum f. sp. narcissi]|uniref:Uncharacterized protein n=1 Tax=Fusarium oxysporum f. sp. narcissi TaxID=451672 RepID=A0A4Q2VQ76_FUSOX|nr:hypothetical protein FOWG_08256 [Fusarium oxysporum f. sp. lycopersici MN25]KAJ4144204.1 hypothetical protein NW765_001362 [Fusarium oxysporum]KAJ4280864.1 hypothetical protein NW764_005208 [Fusarium oxysporum]RYC88551.1 hypothetical protein BFJ63_vAg8613 [Fusarium oxysporum f. sp. narcissi]